MTINILGWLVQASFAPPLVLALIAASGLQNAAAQDPQDLPAAAAPPQGGAPPPPPPPPLHFLAPEDVTTRADCMKAVDEGRVTPVKGKIFVRPNKVRARARTDRSCTLDSKRHSFLLQVRHCIYSENPAIRGWHLGTKGDAVNCVGQCCEFWYARLIRSK